MARGNGAGTPSFGAKVKRKQANVASVRFRFTMASFRDARNLLAAALCDDVISGDEYLLLHGLNRSKNFDLPYDEYTFDMDEMENSECVAEFRVNKFARLNISQIN